MDVISSRIQLSLNWLHERKSQQSSSPLAPPSALTPSTRPPLLQAGGISHGGVKDACLIFLSSGTNTKVVLNKREVRERQCDGGRSFVFGVGMKADNIDISSFQRLNLPDSLAHFFFHFFFSFIVTGE